MADWIQEAIERPGRVRRYVSRLFGSKAFTKKGTIKREYLLKAKKKAEQAGNTSLVHAINMALTLRKFRRKKGRRRKK
ncbi:hypothetical protein [Archaeoglobus veneficus]|uniref:Capsid protein VP2 n=1 Tax=Archaeoglobus veneficus (strain DSM 11195 / SNP6) TaxID=693661 RepID=F2KSJ3_ARCVS|nr:hypothetical protein [Archaeoglobus veneficus]AEA48063.1 hypothetical protein Arcve_2073 [Archaeoglobus veneficus SNP6]